MFPPHAGQLGWCLKNRRVGDWRGLLEAEKKLSKGEDTLVLEDRVPRGGSYGVVLGGEGREVVLVRGGLAPE